jgi:Na+/H+-dicarboxylate symporter
LVVACLYTIASTLGLLALWPVSAHDAAALIAGAKGSGAVTAAAQPGFADWLQGLVPTNPIKSAADDAILPLVVFGTFFGFAATRLESALRIQIVSLFKAIGDIMITIVEWVLVAAPLGVFALSLGVGLRAGFGAAAVLGHYIVVVSAACIGITLVVYAVVAASRRLAVGRFARAAIPVQAVAIGTQSSLATLPAMVEQAREALGVPERIVGLVLPLAVAVFRITSPVANLAVAFFVAAVYGLHPNLLQIASAILVALAVSVGTVGLPGQVSFFASIAPICLTLAVPIDLLPILIAVEVVPDLFRTIGNVTADLAVTAILKPKQGEPQPAEVAPA